MNKKIQLMTAISAFVLAAPLIAAAEKIGVALGEVATISGNVVGLNRSDRVVALQGPQGNVLVVNVDRNVKNFDQVRIGDVVKLEYFESIALYVSSDGKPPEASVAVVAASAPKGKKPAGEIVEVADVSATIQAVDTAKRVVTLKGPQGNLIPVKVDKAVKAFDQLKVGDSLHVRYTEAIAVTVSKP